MNNTATPTATNDTGAAQACAVPLVERLRSVPINCREMIETGPCAHRNIPYGAMCHEAADALAAANDLAKGYAEQNASFAKYISDYSVMSGKYYALALSAVASAERLTAVMSAPLSDPTSKQAWTVFTDTIQAVRESLADIKPVEMTGSLAMLRERVRQLTVEGWTPEHDKQHKPRELAEAGLCYIIAGHALLSGDKFDMIAAPMAAWPWSPQWWKPAADPLRNLEKGGALLAAAWDRQKVAEKEGK